MNTQFIHFTEREGESLSAVKDSRWEPDGVTLHVRFCEGGATYRIPGDSCRYSPLYRCDEVACPYGPPVMLGIRRRANLSLREVAAMSGVTIGRIAEIQSEIESLSADQMLGKIV